MTTGSGDNKAPKGSGGISGLRMAITVLITVLICTGISWALISNLAAAKSGYGGDITTVGNAIGHLKDAVASLDRYATHEAQSSQSEFDNIYDEILGINNELSDSQNQHDQTRKDISDLENVVSSVSSSLGSSLGAIKANSVALDAKVTGLQTIVNGLEGTVTSLQTSIDGLSGIGATVSFLDTTVNSTSNGLNTKVGNLTARVNRISGLQILPTITTSAGNGTITLVITSTQTVASQIVEFRVEFRPTSDVVQLATMDASLAALYSAPPVTLEQGSPGSAPVAAANTNYYLYWSSGAYHLGAISFTTYGTSLIEGTQTKTLAFTCAGSTSYEVTITPLYESTTTSDGGTARSW